MRRKMREYSISWTKENTDKHATRGGGWKTLFAFPEIRQLTKQYYVYDPSSRNKAAEQVS